jgi:hypothetical protein
MREDSLWNENECSKFLILDIRASAVGQERVHMRELTLSKFSLKSESNVGGRDNK